MPDKDTDRPLVTFAIFAYNQEATIAEAMAGALSQTYEPLEIIFSDDFSNDQTYQKILDVVCCYDGPHQVRVRRNANNLGTLSHVLTVAHEARGEFLIVGAGDDVSFSNRVASQSALLSQNPSYVALSSLYVPFSGVLQPIKLKKDWGKPTIRNIESSNFLGCGAIYRSEFLKSLPRPSSKVLYEDVALAFAAVNSGKCIGEITVPTLFYRTNAESSSMRPKSVITLNDVIENENKSQTFNVRYIANIEYYKFLVSTNPNSHNNIDKSLENIVMLRSFWFPLGFKNILLLKKVTSMKAMLFVVPRLFGLRFYAAIWLLKNRICERTSVIVSRCCKTLA